VATSTRVFELAGSRECPKTVLFEARQGALLGKRIVNDSERRSD
jgi:hypothetical protein